MENGQDYYSYKKALLRSRDIAFRELLLPFQTVMEILEELKYKISPFTMMPFDGYTVSLKGLMVTVAKLKGVENAIFEDTIKDEMTGHTFSRVHFYNNYYFQLELVNYYWKGLRTASTYCPVQILYQMTRNGVEEPFIKIGKQMNIMRSVKK